MRSRQLSGEHSGLAGRVTRVARTVAERKGDLVNDKLAEKLSACAAATAMTALLVTSPIAHARDTHLKLPLEDTAVTRKRRRPASSRRA